MAARATIRPEADRRLFLILAIWFVLTSVLGFGSISAFRLLEPGALAPMTASVALHGIVFSGWIVLFVVQVVLIRGNRRALHRRLGRFSLALIALVLLTGSLAVIEKYGMDRKSAREAIYNLLQIATGVALVLAAIAARRNAFVHKRLMLGGASFLAVASAQRAVGFVDGIVGSFPYAALLAMALPLIVLTIYDLLAYRRPWLALAMSGWFALVHVYDMEPFILDQLGGRSAMDGMVTLLGMAPESGSP